ncbi:hypothetical protein B484DRAFT_446787 [Ochromonadaceae sp. CCMP2298]|nr:hypothetical protein B484DRAFT_446787 [Ochromonadaceae sp. CCMP2298]
MAMECPICLEAYSAEVADQVPFLVCIEGHSICRSCRDRIVNGRCPYCNTAMIPGGGFQNRSLVDVIEERDKRKAQEEALRLSAIEEREKRKEREAAVRQKDPEEIRPDAAEPTWHPLFVKFCVFLLCAVSFYFRSALMYVVLWRNEFSVLAILIFFTSATGILADFLRGVRAGFGHVLNEVPSLVTRAFSLGTRAA